VTLKSPLTPGLARATRAILGVGLAHRCTVTPYTTSTQDGYTRRTRTPGAARVGVPCRYRDRADLALSDSGRVVVSRPPVAGGSLASLQTLTVEADDPIKEGDAVSDIRDPAGRPLLEGAAVVVLDLDHSGLGETTLRVLVLRGDSTEAVG
jgi:hypothetical protein